MSTINQFLENHPQIKEIDEVARVKYSKEITALLKKSSELAQMKAKYKEVLNYINDLEKNIIELDNRLFPTIYYGTAKHHSTKEPYIIARTPWKKGKNEYINLRVYCGALSKFKGGKEDPEVKRIALQKMREKIQSILPPVE